MPEIAEWEMSHAFALVKYNCFALLWEQADWNQIGIYGMSCFLKMLEYWLEFPITEDTANGEPNICILLNDSCQCIFYLTTFVVGIQSQVLNFMAVETVVNNAREFTNIVSIHKHFIDLQSVRLGFRWHHSQLELGIDWQTCPLKMLHQVHVFLEDINIICCNRTVLDRVHLDASLEICNAGSTQHMQ